MPIRQLLMVCYAEPFQPFVIYLADGRTLRVPHPEFLYFVSSNRVVRVYDAEGLDIVNLQLVTSLRFEGVQSDQQQPS
jgi:hypothetical protein